MKLKIFDKNWDEIHTWPDSPYMDGYQPDVIKFRGKFYHQVGVTTKTGIDAPADKYLTYYESDVLEMGDALNATQN